MRASCRSNPKHCIHDESWDSKQEETIVGQRAPGTRHRHNETRVHTPCDMFIHMHAQARGPGAPESYGFCAAKSPARLHEYIAAQGNEP